MTECHSKKRKATPSDVVTCPNPEGRDIELNSFGSAITITVGGKAEEFVFHRDLLRRVTPYFYNGLRGNFRNKEQRIVMELEAPGVIKRFQLWLYTGAVLNKRKECRDYSHLSDLILLYVFAERQNIPLLQDDTIDALAKVMGDRHGAVDQLCKPISLVYSCTTEKSFLRGFFAMCMACFLNDEDIDARKAYEHSFPKVFYVDLAFALLRYRDGQSSGAHPSSLVCKYHVHPSSYRSN